MCENGEYHNVVIDWHSGHYEEYISCEHCHGTGKVDDCFWLQQSLMLMSSEYRLDPIKDFWEIVKIENINPEEMPF